MNLDNDSPLFPSIASLSGTQLIEAEFLPRYLQPGAQISLPKMLRWARIDATRLTRHRWSILLAAVEKAMSYPVEERATRRIAAELSTILVMIRREMMRVHKHGIPGCGLRLAETVHGADYCKRMFRSVVMPESSSERASPWLAKQMRKCLRYIG